MSAHRSAVGRQAGAGLVETMVGILIGLVVVLVIYNMLAVTESYKRMSVGASDAQITGLLSHFMVGREASNGGNGISISASDLMTCDPAKANAAWPYNQAGATPALWRPIPAMVRDGGVDVSDSLVTMYSGAPHVIWPVAFTSDAAPGQPFTVQSPNGFSAPSPATTPYLFFVTRKDGTGRHQFSKTVAEHEQAIRDSRARVVPPPAPAKR